MPTPLTPEALEAELNTLPEWSHSAGALHRDLRFADFRAAVAFIVAMAEHAERLQHHPELRNVYNRVSVRLTTHDAGNRVTSLDVALARAIDRLAPGD